MDHTGWLTQDRLLDVWPISHSDYLCIYKIDRCAEKDLIEAMQPLLAIIGGHRPPLQSRKLTARGFKVFDVVTF
ncbi:MAG: hypothetical protein DME27_03260 [Verrucomicrobia bacterium]|nr:MAG: hypothetical protein DME27_03260 [Verrucomicrobiota bacterium]